MIALALAVLSSRRGMPQKWDAAIFGTAVPFSVVVMNFRRWWLRWSFWLSFLICLALHTFVLWFVFEHVFSGVQSIGTLVWFPVAFVESFVLIVFVIRINRWLTGQRETVKLS
jgi:hypothetical protein